MPLKILGDLGLRKIFGGGGSGTFGPGVTLGFNIPFGRERVQDVGQARTSPDNQINRIVAQAKNGGLYSRPTLFKIVMTPPIGLKGWSLNQLRDIGFNCSTITAPGGNIATKPLKTYGLKKEIAYNKIFDEITTGFYLSEEMDEYTFFQDWQTLMYKDNQSLGWYNDYTGTLEIHQLSNKGNAVGSADLGTVTKFTLIDAYPKMISQLALDYGATNTIQRFTVNWTYRDVLIEPVNSKRSNGGNLFRSDADNPLAKKFKLFRDFNDRIERTRQGTNIRFT